MKGKLSLLILLLAAPLASLAAEQLIPAGSLISCIVAEPKLSSKTANIGDPVMCTVSHVEMYGRSTLPYGSFMVGRFEDYKDPGHLVGKGWMELKFDRMEIEPDTVIPLDARVVAVPGYNVDRQGRILGKGHAVRDAIEWSIPILWPIDLINLPRRGPRPTLKEETRLTLKLLDDISVPTRAPLQEESPGLLRRPAAYQEPAPAPAPQPQPVVMQTYVQPMYVPAPVVYYPYIAQPMMPVYYAPAPQMMVRAPAPSPYIGPYSPYYSPY
ncbi:MAG TPA: hypothetical protein VHT24_14555 [Pseudacidobacterium sp.]|jgi:hypothetical protein|nr:hypothetical protein [Pseudacidobacterium sp.]